MLSRERARQLLGRGVELSDEQLERELVRLYAAARAINASYRRARVTGELLVESGPTPTHATLTENELDSFEERAAIMEYEAEFCRSEAEQRAFALVARSRVEDTP